MLERLLILSLVLTACDDGGSAGVEDELDVEVAMIADAVTAPLDAALPVIDAGPSLIEGRECPPDNTTTYANTGGPILISWCVICHSSHVPANQRQGATMGVNFDTVEGIRDQLLRIYARAGDDNDSMPPIDSLSADERRRLGDWIACGAPGLEDAMLPEPGDGALAPDGGATGGPPGRRPGGRDGGMMGRRDGGMMGSRDAGAEPPDMEGCMEDADCEDECARAAMGCSCVERRNGVRACVRNCEEDADCPGNALVCQDQLCQRS
jgi:hypothetical protein